jgi:lipoic acid synthetase
VHPDDFDALGELAKEVGFEHAACGPFVRSSYHADLQAQGKEVK